MKETVTKHARISRRGEEKIGSKKKGEEKEKKLFFSNHSARISAAADMPRDWKKKS